MKFSKILAAAALLSVSVAYAQQPASQDAAQQTQYDSQSSVSASHRNAADAPRQSDCSGPASFCSVYFGGS
ncbi:MAG: hypothetical protein ACRYHA_06550 [Janthinobacterium lividum]